jgi:hypothetical protein
VFFFQLFTLIKPLIVLLQHTIEKQERLPLFKVIWGTLNRLLSKFPDSMHIDTNPITILMPIFQRVDLFCQSNSPSQEMLSFLSIVFTDIKTLLMSKIDASKKFQDRVEGDKEGKASGLSQISAKTLKGLGRFLQKFLVNFSRVVPHNLHEEVFHVFELLLDLLSTYSAAVSPLNASANTGLLADHVSVIIEALTHKYTMRSKAHKKLINYFFTVWILEKSEVAVQQEFNREEGARAHFES